MTLTIAIQKYYVESDPNAIIDLDIFNHHIVVTGATGTGKSTLVKDEILPKYQGLPLWILDPKKRFTGCGKLCTSLDQLTKQYQCVYQPKSLSKEMFGAFCNKLLTMYDIHVVIDEVHLWLTKQSLFRPHYDMIMTKRNDGVTTTSISTNVKAIPNYLLSNVTHVFTLRYNMRSDIDWLFDYIGEKAEFLLAPDLRRDFDTGIPKPESKSNYTFRDLPLLKEFAYIYRDLRRQGSAILRGFVDVT